uniref:Uncharacterized protein n=1 Tax=Corethron hystrix TaxID=216773 RepID=A0A7S1FP96_9STRA|mmetsp:Transcript_17754/g.40262  ORF Transcript_17754/g.40262 Transcript_17754/m.40262 type:complete len:248 (+) Transcript_17754:1034-1777(+)
MYDYNHYNGTPDHSVYATKMKKQQCQNRTSISKKSEPCSSKPGPSEIYHNDRVIPSPGQHSSQLPASYLPYHSQNYHPPAPPLVFQHPSPKNYQPQTFMNYPLPYPSDYHQHISPHHQSLDSSSYNPPNPHIFPSNINPESICMQPPPCFADYTHDLQLNCEQKSSINNHALSTSKNETSHQTVPSNHMPWCSSKSQVLDSSNNPSSPSNYVSQQIFSRNGKELPLHAQEASNMEHNQCIDNYPPHY